MLLTIVLLCVGILGAMRLQSAALRWQIESAARRDAALLAADLAERIRANQAGVAAGAYQFDSPYEQASRPDAVPAPEASCALALPPAGRARCDLYASAQTAARALPGGAFNVHVWVAQTQRVTVMWIDKEQAQAQQASAVCPTGPLVPARFCCPHLAPAGVRCLNRLVFL